MVSPDSPLLDFKSATLYAVRLVLHAADTKAVLDALARRLDEANGFFDGEPVVIDALALTNAPDWRAIAGMLVERGMPVIGVAADETLHEGVRAAGLAAVELPLAREAGAATRVEPPPVPDTVTPADAPVAIPAPAAAEITAQAGVAEPSSAESPSADAASGEPAAPAAAPRATLIVDRSLRSGQKVYARGADLVIVGTVSPGAEVIADGNIHVYGALRGKAMAGARGDEAARIFTTRLDAELVAVAGVYRVIDTRLPENVFDRPAAVRLHAGDLAIEPLSV